MLRPSRVLPSVWLFAVAALLLTPAPAAPAQDADQLWADFGHYVLIAQPQLAGEAANALVEVEAGTLLDAVEAGRFDDPSRIFQRAAGMESIRDVAAELQTKIQSARLDRSREPQRIADDINRLDKGQRAYQNAVNRLRAAGQFAAPQMLATLLDRDRENLHPLLMRAMVDIGQPIVQPLAIALPDLPSNAQGQIARVLADIGYPQSMPALKQVIESDQTAPAARQNAQAAIQAIARNSRASADTPAAQLYLALGNGAYRTATNNPQALDSYDAETDTGVVWVYRRDLTINGEPGLVPIVVPGSVVGDAVAMQAAETALALNPDLDPALSLFIMANLRRENRLPAGEADPSYGSDRQAPRFYAMTAGPQRLQDVLDRALRDNDADLALDAIAALSATASLDALQPLTRGLAFPDRRVRFRAAEALARALPDTSFENDFRVVPALADGVRQSENPVALVVAPDQQDRNQLSGTLSDQGFRTVNAPSVAEAAGTLNSVPGIDLLVVRAQPTAVRENVSASRGNFKLASAPVLAVVSTADQSSVANLFENDPRVTVVAVDNADLDQAIDLAEAGFSGAELSAEEATDFALTALSLLETIALVSSPFEINDALPALIAAVESDERTQVVTAAGDVLRHLDEPDAQAALADTALAKSGPEQVALLIDLAESANAHGNLIPAATTDQLLELVKNSTGDTANAAAQAHGALALPTRNAVDLILNP
jgi:HEAT repeat protein